ncbi:MAG TPA: hypothetical protein VGJ04_09850 [Pirellulales bacterium]
MENKPAFTAKLKGIGISVFENKTDGRLWYSASPSRRFVDSGSKEAKYTGTFNGIADLVLLREVVNQAVAWIGDQQATGDEE